MKSILDLLNELRSLDIKIWSEKGKLRYNAPKGKISAELLAEMQERKEEILTFLERVQTTNEILLQQKKTVKIREIFPRDKTTIVPLSWTQYGLWYIQQLEPESSAYNEKIIHQISGLLDIQALENSVKEIIKRHEVLRTTFPENTETSLPIQLISADFSWDLEEIDLTSLYQQGATEDIQEVIKREVAQPFNLVDGPVWRGILFHLDREEYILLFVFHHIIYDGWSGQIFKRELSAFYNNFVNKNQSLIQLPSLPIQYGDFALKQRQNQHEYRHSKQLKYWQEKLKDAPTSLNLPLDYPRTSVQTLNGDSRTIHLSRELVERLTQLNHQTNTTLFMVLFATLVTLLYRYTREEDICIGVPLSNRSNPEVRNLIGFFVNTVVIRSQLSSDLSFLELLKITKKTILEAYYNSQVTLQELAHNIPHFPNSNTSFLFQVLFVFYNYTTQDLKLSELKIQKYQIELEQSKLDLTFAAWELDSGLIIQCRYNKELFDSDTIKRLLGYFQVFLEGIVANPNAPIIHLPLLTARERQQILVDWNQTQADYPKDKCIHQLFEEQVERTPNNVEINRILSEQAHQALEFDEGHL